MTVIYTGRMNIPNYTALTADLVDGKIPTAQPGMVIYFSDTAAWKIVKADQSLADYVLPVNVTLAGDVEIGAVEIKNASDDTRIKVGAVSGLTASDNGMVMAATILSGSKAIGNVEVTSGSININNFPSSYLVSGSVSISGSISVGNFPTTYSGSITNLPAIQIISGCITNLSDVLISGSVAIKQDVIEDALNSFSGSLASSGSFVGTPVSTLGVAGIQVSLYTNQNCTVYVEQSPDSTNWDISDTYNYYTSKPNFGVTVQAISSYYRVSVKNIGLATTTVFRLQTALCPIVESVPRSLTQDGNMRVAVEEFHDLLGFEALNTPNGEMRVITPYRLVGSGFSGSILDTIYWTAGSGSGSIVVGNAQAILTTGSTANGGTTLQSFRVGRYIGGASNRCRIIMRLPDTGTANNIRRFGAFTTTDGAFFELDGTTNKVVTRKNSIDAPISSGSFNGELGKSISVPTDVRTWEIYWNNSKVHFAINNLLVHTVSASSTTWTANLSLPIRFENINSNSGSAVVDMNVRNGVIHRLGAALSQPTSYYHSGQTAGSQLKIGAGNLHSIILGSVTDNAVITLSDSLTTTTPTIFNTTVTSTTGNPIALDFKGLPFFNGLRLAVTTQNANVIVIYE